MSPPASPSPCSRARPGRSSVSWPGSRHGNDIANVIAAGDLDGDGRLDLVLGVYFGMRVMIDTGGGVFADRTATALPRPRYQLNDLALGDVDDDGDLDIVTANIGGSSSPAQNRVYLNNGRGAFAEQTSGGLEPHADVTWAVALVDLDRDRHLEVVFADPLAADRLLFNTTRQVFAPRRHRIGTVASVRWHGWTSTGSRWILSAVGARRVMPPVVVPGLGLFFLDPAATAVLPWRRGAAANPITDRFAVPADPRLVGQSVYFQHLVHDRAARCRPRSPTTRR